MEEAKLDDAKLCDIAGFFDKINGVLGEASEWIVSLDEPTQAFVAQMFLGVARETVCVLAATNGDMARLEKTMAEIDKGRFDHRICLSGICTVVAVDKKMRAGLIREEGPCC